MESMSAKWEEMFGVRGEEVGEEVKVKKPRKTPGRNISFLLYGFTLHNRIVPSLDPDASNI